MFLYFYHCTISRNASTYRSTGTYVGHVKNGDDFVRASNEIFEFEKNRASKYDVEDFKHLDKSGYSLVNFNLLHEVSK